MITFGRLYKCQNIVTIAPDARNLCSNWKEDDFAVCLSLRSPNLDNDFVVAKVSKFVSTRGTV